MCPPLSSQKHHKKKVQKRTQFYPYLSTVGVFLGQILFPFYAAHSLVIRNILLISSGVNLYLRHIPIRHGGYSTTIGPLAAILRQISQHGIHAREIRFVYPFAAVADTDHQSRMLQLRQVVVERRRRHTQTRADLANRQPPRPHFDQQTEDVQPRIMGQSTQRFDDICFFHISRYIEILTRVKRARYASMQQFPIKIILMRDRN